MKKVVKFIAIYLVAIMSISSLISNFSYGRINPFASYNITLTSNLLGGAKEISFSAKLYKNDVLVDLEPSISISSSRFAQISFKGLDQEEFSGNLKVIVNINEGLEFARFRNTEKDTFESEVFSLTGSKTISMGYIDVAKCVNIIPREHGRFEKEQYYFYAGDKLPRPIEVDEGYAFTGFTLTETNNYANQPSPSTYQDNVTYYACYEKRIGFNVEVIDSKVPFTGRSISPKVRVTYNGQEISSQDYFVADEAFVEAGNYTLHVYGLNDYEYYEGSGSFEIIKADPILKFNNSNSCEVNLEDKYFVNTASNNFNAKVNYEIISGSDFASVDENSGVVSLIGAGGAVIRASVNATSNYNAASITYNLKINKRAVTPLFKYKVIQIKNKNNLPDNELLNVTGANITYSSQGTIGEVDSDTGKVTLNGKKGFLKVNAYISNNLNNVSFGNSDIVKATYTIYMVGTDKIEYKVKNYTGTYLGNIGNLIETSSNASISYKVNNKEYSTSLDIDSAGIKKVEYKISDNNTTITGSTIVVINRKNINELQFPTLSDVKYNTVFQRPMVELTDNGKTLTSNDFTVSYQNNIHKGIGIVWIRGINNYTGNHILTFNILPLTFSVADTNNDTNEVIFFPADETPQRVYTSQEMIVEDFNVANYDKLSSVKSGEKKVLFKRGIDYDITYYNNINVNASGSTGASGSKAYIENAPCIKVVGKGDIEGVGYYNYGITEMTTKAPYHLEKINFEYSNGTFVLPRGLVYVANDGIKSKISMVNGDGSINHRWHNTYTSVYQCKRYESNAFAPFKTYSRTGEQKISIQIYAANPNLEFSNGKITKKYGDNDFKNDISFNHDDNYSLKYYSSNGDVASVDDSGNVHINGAGTASIFAHLNKENNYEEGMSSYEITVNPKTITNNMISLKDSGSYLKTGYEICPIVVSDNNEELIENKDYIVEYSDNINSGTATAVITGTGNYEGKITKTFNILQNDELPDDDEETTEPKKIIFTLPSNDLTYTGVNQSTNPIVVSEPINAKVEYKLAGDTSFSINTPLVKNANVSGYDVYYRISSDGYTTEEGSYKVVVKKANIIQSNINISKTYNYDSLPHSPSITASLINNAKAVVKYYTNSSYTTEIQKPEYSDPGDYTIYFGIKDEDDNYNEYKGSFVFTIIKQIKDIKYTVDDITKTYDGEVINNPTNISVSDPVQGYSITYSTTENGVYEPFINIVNANASQKKVYFKITATDYNEVKGSFYVKINKAEIPDSYSVIIPNDKLTYNGSSQGYALEVNSFLSDNKTKPEIYYSNINNSSSFTKTPPMEINAGTYTKYYVLKDLNGNYNDSSIRVYSFKIEKKEVEDNFMALVSNNIHVYDANYKSADLTAPTLGSDTPEIIYSDKENGEYTSQKPHKINAGVYTMWYKFAESKNYLESTARSYTLTINKRDITSANYIADDIDEVYSGIEKDASIQTKNILGNSEVIVTYSDSSSGTFTSSVPKYKDVIKKTIYFKINVDNYNEYIGSFNISIKPATINSANVIIPTKTEKYDGNEKTGLTGPIEVKNLINNPEYKITFLNENEEYTEKIPTKTEPGKYTINFKIEVDNYLIYYDSYEIYITTSAMDVIAESIVVDYDGKQHFVTPQVVDIVDYEIEYSEDGINYRKDNYSYTNASSKPYTVYYRVIKNGYDTFPGSFNITINFARIKEENITITGNKGIYNNDFYLGSVSVGDLIGNPNVVVLYGLTHSGPFEDRSNLVGRKDAGNNTIYFKVIANNYEEYISSYIIEIEKANFNDKVVVNEIQEEYDGTKKYGADINIDGLIGNPNIIIYYKENEESEEYYEQRPYLIEAGTKTVWYKITAGNNYNDVYGKYTINVSKKEDPKYTVRFFNINGDELTDYRTSVRKIEEIVFPDEKIYEVENKIFLSLACKKDKDDEDYILLSDMENIITYDFDIYPLYIEDYSKVTEIKDIDYFKNLDKNSDEISISVTFNNENGEVSYEDIEFGEYEVVIQIIVNGKIIKEERIKNVKYIDKEEKPKDEFINIPIYRLYNKSSGEHLFTTRINEYNKLGQIGWEKEGKAFDAYSVDNRPKEAVAVYRLYNKNGLNKMGDHHYTKSTSEMTKLKNAGWTVDFNGDAAFYVLGDITVYKMYNANSGAHHYTPKDGEKNKMAAAGWFVEGTAWTVNGYYNSNGDRITK